MFKCPRPTSPIKKYLAFGTCDAQLSRVGFPSNGSISKCISVDWEVNKFIKSPQARTMVIIEPSK